MILISVLSAVLGAGGLGSLATAFIMRDKIKAESISIGAQTADVLQKAAINLVDPLNEHIDSLNNRIELLERTVHDLVDGTRKLVHQLEENGLKPVWHPTISQHPQSSLPGL